MKNCSPPAGTSSKMENVSSGDYTLDDALSAVGFGTFQGFALVFAGIGWFSEAMEIFLLSFIGPALKFDWLLSPTQESLLTTTVFAGMLVGSYFWGFISDNYGRRLGLRGALMVTYAAGFLSAFSPDYASFVVLRFFLGFGCGGGHIFSSWFLEFIPKSNRGVWMLVCSSFWVLGELFEASIAWIIMPRLGWRWLLALSSVPSLIALILSNFAPESPRFLFTQGRTNEAITALENIALINKKELPTGNLVIYHQTMQLDEENITSEETPLLSSNENKTRIVKKCLKSLCELFSSDLLGTTLLVWTLSFAYNFACYGIQLMISALTSGQSDCGSLSFLHKTVENESLYISAFITCLVELPGYSLAMVLVERFGRKLCMEILTILAIISMLPLLSHQNGTVTIALLISGRMFLAAAFTTLNIYSKEVYPTSVRATGFGCVTGVGRIGGMICPLVAVGLVRGCHQTLAIVMFGIIILISAICVVVCPFETKGRALKDTVSYTESMESNS